MLLWLPLQIAGVFLILGPAMPTLIHSPYAWKFFGTCMVLVGLFGSLVVSRAREFIRVGRNAKIAYDGEQIHVFDNSGKVYLSCKVSETKFCGVEQPASRTYPSVFLFKAKGRSFKVYANIGNVKRLFSLLGVREPTSLERGDFDY